MSDIDTPIFPIAAWTVGPVPRLDLIVFRPDFLTHALQKSEEATPGRTYGLSRAQARQLADALLSALEKLETAGTPGHQGPTH